MSELFEEKLSSRYFLSKMAIPYEYKIDTMTGKLDETRTTFRYELDLRGQTNINTGLRAPSQINFQKILKVRRAKLYKWNADKTNMWEMTQGEFANISFFLHASFSMSENNFVSAFPTDQAILDKKWVYNPNQPIDIWMTTDGKIRKYTWVQDVNVYDYRWPFYDYVLKIEFTLY